MFKRTLATLGLMCLVTGCGSSMESLGGKNSPNLSDQDNMFFKSIAQSNMTEIQSSQMALTMSNNTEVKEFAQRMIDQHGMATTNVDNLAQTKGVMVPMKLDDTHMALVDAGKGKMGADFDKAYLDAQVKAHEATIAADQKEIDGGTDPDVKMQAQKLLPILNMHLQMAMDLQKKMM